MNHKRSQDKGKCGLNIEKDERERERAETPFTKFILLVILAAGTGMQMFGSDTRECAVRCDGCFDVNIATTVTHNSCQISVTYQTLF